MQHTLTLHAIDGSENTVGHSQRLFAARMPNAHTFIKRSDLHSKTRVVVGLLLSGEKERVLETALSVLCHDLKRGRQRGV